MTLRRSFGGTSLVRPSRPNFSLVTKLEGPIDRDEMRYDTLYREQCSAGVECRHYEREHTKAHVRRGWDRLSYCLAVSRVS